ncbi:MAG TPA: tetratricopeptide repeat protein [Usitatibacter sp.]|nr:tetratricopeptide repeat protein [Usitatibacter sp.]
MRLAAVLFVACALCGLPSLANADPTETDPNLAASDEDYAAGTKAIAAKQWEEAIARLRKAEARHPDHADLQNYLGFAHRNLKQFDAAFRHYERAIELEPRHRGAHEYIGEAYLMVGDLPNAEKHLAALRAICLLPCEELTDLEEAVAKYRSGATAPPPR